MSRCHYHEASEASQACARCGKLLCEQCLHTDYPEYCWSCGLDHSNELVEREQALRRPEGLSGPTGTFIIAKLAAAGGTYVALSVAIGVILGVMDSQALLLATIMAAYFSAGVIYTYGIVYSLLVDVMTKFIRLKLAIVEAMLYFIGGLIFPQMIQMKVWLGQGAYDWSSIISALIFFGMNRWFMRRRDRTSTLAVAIVTLIPAMILMLVYVIGMIQG